MKGLDDGPDRLNDQAWDAALGVKPRHVARALDRLISAARSLSSNLSDVSVAILPSGSVSIHIRTRGSDAAVRLASDLGCNTPEIATDGRHEWIAAERGEYGDQVVISVTGGHRPVCQCHPRDTQPRGSNDH